MPKGGADNYPPMQVLQLSPTAAAVSSATCSGPSESTISSIAFQITHCCFVHSQISRKQAVENMSFHLLYC